MGGRKACRNAYERIVREATTTLDFVPSISLHLGNGDCRAIMAFHVLDEPCMLLRKFLLREKGLAISLAFYHPPLRGTWNGRG